MYTTVQPLSKYLRIKSVRIYDVIFILHTKCTAVLLLTCSALLSANQYFGNPISCVGDVKNIDFTNQYCWTMGTFILSYFDMAHSGDSDIMRNTVKYGVAEGIGPEEVGKTQRLYLRYYQWVVLLLLLESLVFFFPAFLWKMWEGQRLEHLCEDVRNPILTQENYQGKGKMLFKYFSTNNKDLHMCYMFRYMLCEVLNLFISIINIILLDIFLDNFWSKYIYALMTLPHYDWNTWNHMSSRVFPKIAKCTLPKFGAAGSAISYDLLCLLPLNILNEKVFAFLWGWFLLMILLAGINILYRLALLCSPGLRFFVLRVRLIDMSKDQLNVILSSASTGDWFILNKVASNINPVLFKDVMLQLYRCQIEKADEISV